MRPPAFGRFSFRSSLLAVFGWWRLPRPARFFAGCVVLVPVLLLAPARFSQSASPETRHLIFMLPFFSTALAAGLVALIRQRIALASALVLLFAAQIGWAWHRTPALFEGESATRIETRQEASDLARGDCPAG